MADNFITPAIIRRWLTVDHRQVGKIKAAIARSLP
jgi:hypothetical protein